MSNFPGIGGSGSGFQLFTQANNDPGIYADAAARDVYFGANPSDLARADNNEFLIIKLIDNGSAEIAYQQRQSSIWVDVTSLIQGEDGLDGPPGDITGPGTTVDSSLLAWDGLVGGIVKEIPIVVDDTGELTFTSINNNTTKMNAPEIIQINSAAQLTAMAVADVITVTGNLVLELNIPLLESEVRFVLSSTFPVRARLEIRGATPLFAWEYNGPTAVTFVTGVLGDFIVNNIGLVDRTGGVKLIDIDNGLTRFGNATIRRWDDYGDHVGGTFESTFTRFADYEQGFRITNTGQTLIVAARTLFDLDGAILFSVFGSWSESRNVEISGVSGEMQPNSSLVRVDPAFRESSRINISGCTLSGGKLLNIDGIGGTFISVSFADAITVPVPIDSITGAPFSLATFNFDGVIAGVEVHVGQQVIPIGQSNANYNRTMEITETDGTTFFRCKSIFFGPNTTLGTFTSNSITLTDIGTALVDLDTVFLTTDLSIDYDFGSTVYDKQTDSFRVNLAEGKMFTGTATGSWSTRGLDQTSPKVLASNNPNFMASKTLAFAELNGNVALTTSTNGTYAAINVPGLSENGITERFKLINPNEGVFMYTGKEEYEKVGSAIIYATKSGSTRNYKFAISIDGAIPDFVTAPFSPFSISPVNNHTPLILPLNLLPGETFQIMQAGDGFGDSFTITDMFITD